MANMDLGSLGALGCPAPFVSDTQFPYTGGEAKQMADMGVKQNSPAASAATSPKASRAVCPVRLRIGCILKLAFIVPLGSKPNLCHDEITPGDMHTSLSCAWSGALLVAGAMSCAVWIMLRSLWTHLRVCWDVAQTRTLFLLTQLTGWGLPGLFLALCIPITGVSYRIGSACVPNQKNAFVTWFGWLIAFACIAALLQFITTTFCLWLYLKDMKKGQAETTTISTNASQDRTLAWRRVRKVLSLQWRSIVLTTLVIIESVYFGVVFIHETSTADRLTTNASDDILEWAFCLVRNQGRKDECLNITKVLGLSEGSILASFFLAALIGLLTFSLMIRRSMLRGWSALLLHPRRPSVGEQDFIIISPKRKSFGKQLESEKGPHPNIDTLLSPVSPVSPIMPTSVFPDTPATEAERTFSFPEAGEVDRRHETTNWFDEEGDEGERAVRARERRGSRIDDIA
ncbi:hypothetical protein PRZ48_012897 [Zasmidium cellare]|uniref:G-protein coupled receptors family 2 profile 2 domain-containing protein n=1 Tax=Zasmidium cellare TaxID=395010 RepID=A0ABR0E2R9_ZASCE|nr:hypothetical protein PRZ48_012897 [Zasmidium cellare]